ncbi:MAG: CDP-alcohol phosphatidyltransferase family protein [Pirellulaceae bacterium]|nr:CDP-alcohol phosphatidyltransferase family protein [Pirellulaceae bacterium]
MDLSDRRPLSSRRWKISHSLTTWLSRCGMTPNMISFAGMLFGIAAGITLAMTAYLSTEPDAESGGSNLWVMILFLFSALLIQLRLLCNLLDGMVAEAQQSFSPIGALYNEIPDRVSDVATLVGAGYALGGCVVGGYISACLAVFIAYIRVQGKVAGASQYFCGPMAKPQRMFAVTVASGIASFFPIVLWSESERQVTMVGTLGIVLWLIILGEVITIFRRLTLISSELRKEAKNEF